MAVPWRLIPEHWMVTSPPGKAARGDTPLMMISFTFLNGEQALQDDQCGQRVRPRADVIGNHAGAAGQSLEMTYGKGFHNIEDPEQNEPRKNRNPRKPCRACEAKRDHLPDDLVNYDALRIVSPEGLDAMCCK